MNSNKIINLVDFYQSLGVEYFIDDINIKSLQTQTLTSVSKNHEETKVVPKNQPDFSSQANKMANELLNAPLTKRSIPTQPKPQVSVSVSASVNIPKKEPVVVAPVEIKKEIKLDHITTLEKLKEEVLNFESCSLKKTAINTVFGSGDESAEIMVVGEAPGADEDASGEPFVGRSGKLLMKAIESIGLTRDKVFITNTIFWRPPGNRNPTIEEMQLCYPFLKRMIEIINPKLIIIVGKVATGNLIKSDDPIGKMRGKWYDLDLDGKSYTSRVVFHPSYLLRNSTQKKALWLDLLDIKDKIKSIQIEN